MALGKRGQTLIAKAKAVKPRVPPPVKPPAPKKPVKKTTEKEAFLWAEGQQESGGNYRAVNSSSGALGKWQVMPANLPSWLHESGLPDMTPEQFLDSDTAQNKVAETILGGDFDRYGPRGAASVWYSGQPDWRATYGDPPVYQYVDDVIALMAHAPSGGITLPGAGGGPGAGPVVVPLGKVPAPGKDDWSADIRTASDHITSLANSAHNHTVTLNRLTINRSETL
jgi:hypothetical protein